VKFADDEVGFKSPEGAPPGTLACAPFDASETIGEGGLDCRFDGATLEITITDVREPTGLFKLSVETFINPPSLRGTSAIEEVYISTQNDAERISEYTTDIYILPETASEILDLDGDINIVNTPKGYDAPAEFALFFYPSSVSKKYPVSIFLQYPSTAK
jgi:hypothetical protein